MRTKRQSKSGYTLIELVIVIALSAILLLTAVSLFFTTFIGGGKTASSEYTKQAGVRVMDQMTYYLRNSKKLVANAQGFVCASGMQSVAVQNLDGTTTVFSVRANGSVNGIAMSTGLPVTAANSSFLTPTDVGVTSAGLSINCSPTSYGTSSWDGSPPRLTISFNLQKGIIGIDKARDIVSIPFNSSVTLRNF